MTMAQFEEEERLAKATNKDCELCGTYVHIETEYLNEKGCVYCHTEESDHEHIWRFTLWEEAVNCIVDDCDGRMESGQIERALAEWEKYRRNESGR